MVGLACSGVILHPTGRSRHLNRARTALIATRALWSTHTLAVGTVAHNVLQPQTYIGIGRCCGRTGVLRCYCTPHRAASTPFNRARTALIATRALWSTHTLTAGTVHVAEPDLVVPGRHRCPEGGCRLLLQSCLGGCLLGHFLSPQLPSSGLLQLPVLLLLPRGGERGERSRVEWGVGGLLLEVQLRYHVRRRV